MVTASTTRSRFHVLMGLTLAITIVVGFARSFYLRWWFSVPPLSALLDAHGVLMTLWVLFYLTQVSLVSAGQLARHRRNGKFGAAFVAILVLIGLPAISASAAAPKAHVWGLSSAQFSLIPIVELAGFAGFVSAALYLRGSPQVHKRLMLLAMITAIAPATARIISLTGMSEHYLVLQTVSTAALVGWMGVSDWRQSRTLHRVTAIWGTLLIASWPVRMWMAGTVFWAPLGRWIASLNGTS